ncbi:MAG: hypothetical protein ACKVX9_18875 [Blastocatellia bacterium]
MNPTIAERKRIEIDRKFDSLESEFKHWLDQSASGGPFEKHHSQILAVKAVLDGLRKNTRLELERAAQSGAILTTARQAETMILAIFRLWEYFRAKFAQRNEKRFAGYLRAADEFAWACYQPAQPTARQTAPISRRKEPPLVFLNGGASPFALSRNREFEAEVVPDEELTRDEYLEVLRSLPISVVGVPYFQLSHLPDALVLGHEIGHTVEDDFGLTARLKEILQEALDRGVLPARHAAWHAWLGELFADLYGGLAAGPAFVGALIDFLARDPNEIREETRSSGFWDIYPTDYLRILFNLETLREDFDADRQRMESDWRKSYDRHQLAEFEPDLKIIVPALLDGRFPELGDRRLREVLRFTKDQQEEAKITVRQLMDEEAPASADLRVLLAAARLGYEQDPAAYESRNLPAALLAHIQGVIKPGTRAGEALPEEEELAARAADYETSGDRLFQELWPRLRF